MDLACQKSSRYRQRTRAMPASGRKLQTLPLKRKIELIDTVEKRPAG